MDQHTVFATMNERERLGSTGIGHGIALPHGRLNGIQEPIAAAMTLQRPLNFDAIDDQPITLVVGLLVPAEATDQHLRILSDLAGAFSDSGFRRAVSEASDADTLFNLLI
jgi:PTS system nitrogen regulatory IIA component